MNNLIVPSADIAIRPATPRDLDAVDALQKRDSESLGFLHRATLEGKVANGDMLVATDRMQRVVGYVIGTDTYFKREDVGVVYQMAVAEHLRRSNVAATLLKALFASWPYGTRLCCAWCAQDLAANRFWEAMGFVALAYRAGSAGKGRVHIFWQKRIVEGDAQTAWWYPSITGSGAIREDRLVLPIPEGQHWSDARPMVLPRGEEELTTESTEDTEKKVGCDSSHQSAGKESDGGMNPTLRPGEYEEREGKIYHKGKRLMTAQMMREEAGVGKGQMYMVPHGAKLVREMPVLRRPRVKAKKKVKEKHDPRLVSAVRELRDRWLEHVNGHGLLLPDPTAAKYAVGRERSLPPASEDRLVLPMPMVTRRLLPAA